MRFMVIVKATKESEAGVLPDEGILTEMGKYNEELMKAASFSQGKDCMRVPEARVKFSGKDRIVTDGPFAETKELIAGFWLRRVNSKEEAIEWLKRGCLAGSLVWLRVPAYPVNERSLNRTSSDWVEGPD